MPKAAPYLLAWSATHQTYILSERENNEALDIVSENRAWFAWLDEARSFAFQGKAGTYTARKESIRPGDAYWYAYMRTGEKLTKKYLGKTGEVTLARLEQVARTLKTDRVTRLLAEHEEHSQPSQIDSHASGSAVEGGSSTDADLAPHTTSVQRDPLLATKLYVPHPRTQLVHRSRLIERLQQAMERPLTLVSAPAGFGKTTLLSSWVQSFPQENPETPHVAWVSLDESDNEPVLFWTYALTALDTVQPGLCTQLLAYLRMQQASTPLRYVLQALINTLASRTEQFLLVFDDYHLITEPEIHSSLTYLVEHLPPQLHLILATRADPPLPLSLLRSHGEVLEVRTNQLRCTPEEVMAFFKEVMGMHLSRGLIQEVTTRTEGWLVGLQLLGLSLQGQTNPDNLLEEVSGSQHYILDYLMEEVLRGLPRPVQAFLLRTSILERLSASLCDAVLKQTGSQKMLEFLERANVFVVPLDEQRRWYRYHALFAEALRSLLEQTEGKAMCALHLRASCWYAERGYRNEAVRHAISAGNWPRAADLIEQEYAFVWLNSEHAMVRRWLEKLPVEVVRSQPRLCLAYAKTLFMVAPYTTVARWLHDAERALRAALPTPTNETADSGAHPSSELSEWNNLLGEIAAYSAIITGYHLGEGPATLAFCQQALAHLPEQNLLVRAEVGYAQSLAYHSCGDIVAAIQSTQEAAALVQAAGNTTSTIFYLCRTAYYLLVHGKLREMLQVVESAALLGTTPGGLSDAMVCWAYIFHAIVLREWNRLDEALDRILQGVRLSEQTETIVSLYYGYTELMRVYLARGEMEAARSAFQQAEEAMARTYSPHRRDVYVIVEWVQFWLASGALDRAIRWAPELAQQSSVPSPLTRERQEVARARILLAQKKPIEALSLLEPLEVIAEQQERWSHVIEMQVLQALAHFMRGKEQEALSMLAQAVHLAEPEGYIRCFVDEGAPMELLLSRLRAQERKQGPTPYLDSVLAAFAPSPRTDKAETRLTGGSGPPLSGEPTSALLEPLSARELEVLRLLEQGASNQEIAEGLVLALSTVKSHVRTILAKLGVSNRTQAVKRARTLGLLPDKP
jgi:ATP/maltotriose-dependent transcriptional regulator MalT